MNVCLLEGHRHMNTTVLHPEAFGQGMGLHPAPTLPHPWLRTQFTVYQDGEK